MRILAELSKTIGLENDFAITLDLEKYISTQFSLFDVTVGDNDLSELERLLYLYIRLEISFSCIRLIIILTL